MSAQNKFDYDSNQKTHYYTIELQPVFEDRMCLFSVWKGVYRNPEAHKLMTPILKGFALSQELAKRKAWNYMKEQGATRDSVVVCKYVV